MEFKISSTAADLLRHPDDYPTTSVAPGRKDDSGKAPWSLLMCGCALALAGVVQVLKFGSQKYAADSWQNVDQAETRYKDALYRHLHSIEVNGFMSRDAETGLLEWYHVACNALFLAHFAAKKEQYINPIPWSK